MARLARSRAVDSAVLLFRVQLAVAGYRSKADLCRRTRLARATLDRALAGKPVRCEFIQRLAAALDVDECTAGQMLRRRST